MPQDSSDELQFIVSTSTSKHRGISYVSDEQLQDILAREGLVRLVIEYADGTAVSYLKKRSL
jgi:hypothetical protein